MHWNLEKESVAKVMKGRKKRCCEAVVILMNPEKLSSGICNFIKDTLSKIYKGH